MSRSVVCYCYHVSHVFNLGEIPAMLAARGWHVRWLNAFPATAMPGPLADGIDYRFDVPLEAVGQESASLYLTPLVAQAAHFPRGALRVHFLVSLTSLEGVYDEGMFDHYDAIVCAGRHHIEEFEALVRRRNLADKLLLRVGYPKLDGQRRQLQASGLVPPESPLTVVFAPTHGYYINSRFSVVGQYGRKIIGRLTDAGVKVVFRPHMESWRDQDREEVEGIASQFDGHPLFALDRSGNYFETYAQSHLMLTDISGTGFTYAFTFGRPALFFAPDPASEEGKRGIQFERRENIGLVVRDLDALAPAIQAAHRHSGFLQGQIAGFREYLLFNVGTSEASFVEHALPLLEARSAAKHQR